MSITLQEIKAQQTKLAEMIAAFDAQARTSIQFPEQLIELASGEHYAGIIIGKDGEQSYHLILLPGDGGAVDWEDAKAWAKEQGGELPTRREQSLLFANLKEHFESAWYWSSEQHPSDGGFAFYQHFGHGNQDYGSTYGELRARAVRRLTIE